jgi:hypothetical protein
MWKVCQWQEDRLTSEMKRRIAKFVPGVVVGPVFEQPRCCQKMSAACRLVMGMGCVHFQHTVLFVVILLCCHCLSPIDLGDVQRSPHAEGLFPPHQPLV